MKRFNIIRFWFCYLAELNHRYMFDYVFLWNADYSLKDKINIRINKFIFWLYPSFRTYIKYWSPIIKRAYNIKSIKSVFLFKVYRRIRHKNYQRYT